MGISKEWALNLYEKKILGEKHIIEYYQKVDEYSIKKAAETFLLTSIVELLTLCMAGALTLVICCGMVDKGVPKSTNIIIGILTLSSIMIAAGAIAISIGKGLEVEGEQNPKDWKAEILNQKILKKGSYSKKVIDDTLKNTPLEINV